MRTAKWCDEITVIDPDTKAGVQLDVFKHENGGIFAVDASYLDQCFDDDKDPVIPDPLNDAKKVKLIGF